MTSKEEYRAKAEKLSTSEIEARLVQLDKNIKNRQRQIDSIRVEQRVFQEVLAEKEDPEIPRALGRAPR